MAENIILQTVLFAKVLAKYLQNQYNPSKMKPQVSTLPPISPDVLRTLRARLSELRRGREDVLRAVHEEEMVEKMLAFYGEAGQSEGALREALVKRLDALRADNDKLLPMLEEEDRLGRLLSFYQREERAREEPITDADRQQLRRSQRLMARRQIAAHEDRQRREQAESRNDRVHRMAAEQDAVTGTLKEATAAEAAAARVFAGRSSVGASRLMLAEVKDASDNSSPLLNAGVIGSPSRTRTTSTSPEVDSVPYKLGNAVREYLVGKGIPRVPFTELYEDLRPVIDQLFPRPGEKAQIEAFRYHLQRVANWFGLHYERGYVELLPADRKTRAEDETIKANV